MTRTPRLLLVALGFAATTAFALAPDLTGKWTFRVVTANGTGTPTVTLKQEGDKVTGTYESNALGTRALSGRVHGDSVTFTLAADGDGLVLTYSAHIVTADSLNGYVDFAGQGGAELTATRQK
jgi:hypothetical protein